MKRKRFTEEQIIGVLKEAEVGTRILARAAAGVSEATISDWKSRCGGLAVSEAKRQKVLAEEGVRLRQLLAYAIRDQAALNGIQSRPRIIEW